MYIPVSSATLVSRDLYSAPPPAQTWIQDNPTLLVSWWCTLFSVTIIMFRLAGRWIRTEKLFLEDKIMAGSIIPLMLRMGFAHIVLRNGTNNTILTGLGAAEIAGREYGSKFVLAARVFYAMFLWIAKLTIAEFLRRLCANTWKRGWEIMLNGIRWFLLATFIGSVISTLVECRPFDNYWQVDPDPGPQCRQAYVQLFVMGLSDMITDIVLVAFPMYIVLTSQYRMKRKISLSALFGLSLILVGITIYRIYGTIQRDSQQQFRTLLASLEILAATAVSNALVLGSFVRDKGVKKNKFKLGSTGGESTLDRPNSRSRPRVIESWGSDTDLVSGLGMRLGSQSVHPDDDEDKPRVARPAPAALPLLSVESASPKDTRGMFPHQQRRLSEDTDETDLKTTRSATTSAAEAESLTTPRKMSFFDVGGLLDMPNQRAAAGTGLGSPASETFTLTPLMESRQERTDEKALTTPRRWSRILRSRSEQRDQDEGFPMEDLEPRR